MPLLFVNVVQASALSKLRPQGYEVALRGCALLGYVAAGCTVGVLLATRVRKKCTLPGGHAVFLVVDSQWVLIPLQVCESARRVVRILCAFHRQPCLSLRAGLSCFTVTVLQYQRHRCFNQISCIFPILFQS